MLKYVNFEQESEKSVIKLELLFFNIYINSSTHEKMFLQIYVIAQ